MKVAIVCAVALAACVPPQQPSYYQGAPPPGGQPPPAGGGAYVPAPAASCQDTATCYSQCNPLTDQCMQWCDSRTTPASAQNAHAMLQCMAQSGCSDQTCVAQQCGAQITTCTNLTLATTPAAPSGGTSCEAVMQPQYNVVNALWIPPVTCALTQADLTGEWDSGQGTGRAYFDASGNYAGGSTISTASHRSIDAQGNYVEDWTGATTSTGGAFAHGTKERTTGTFILLGNNTVLVSMNPNEYTTKTSRQYYIVAGWFADTDEITMSLVGPFNDPPTQQDLQNASSTSYNHEDFHRRR